MGSGGRNESNSHLLARNGEKRIFHELVVHHVCKVGIKRFLAQEAKMSLTPSARPNRREENFSSTRRTSGPESKNKRFWPQEAEMSLTTISSLESARRKFFMNTT